VAAYVLSGFKQSEALILIEYWPGQVPCDTNTDPPFPCPAGGNAAGVPDSAIQQGVEEWSVAPSLVDTTYAKLGVAPAGSVCGGAFAGLDTLKRATDGRNTIMWAPLGGSAIGIACWNFGTNECDIILDNTWPGMADPEAARTVLLHEAGHCIGLAHSLVAGSVMLATYGGPRHLHADDVAGYCAIYGCNGPPPPSGTPTGASPTASPTLTPSPTASPTPTPLRCAKRLWLTPQAFCARAGAIARD
jgi:hypothetical protein